MGSWPLRSKTDRDTAPCPVKHVNSVRPEFATTTLPVVSAWISPILSLAHEYIVVGDEAAEITQAGTRFLTEFGIDLSALSSTRRHFCRLCLDWTERRPHIAGAVGAALTKRCFDLGWTERMKHSRAVIVTASGKHGFLETFGIGMPEKSGNGTRGR